MYTDPVYTTDIEINAADSCFVKNFACNLIFTGDLKDGIYKMFLMSNIVV